MVPATDRLPSCPNAVIFGWLAVVIVPPNVVAVIPPVATTEFGVISPSPIYSVGAVVGLVTVAVMPFDGTTVSGGILILSFLT